MHFSVLANCKYGPSVLLYPHVSSSAHSIKCYINAVVKWRDSPASISPKPVFSEKCEQ